MCGFIAQLVEHRTSIAEVTGLNPVEALIFSGFFFPIALIGKFTAMIIRFHLHSILWFNILLGCNEFFLVHKIVQQYQEEHCKPNVLEKAN